MREILCLFLLSLISLTYAAQKPRVLPVVQLIRFPNDPCIGTNNRNGTCYTSDECTSKSGTNGGSCANGYGVCCIFERGCGMRTSENCTFFTSNDLSTDAANPTDCALRVCPCGTNICQLRLDFNTFNINGPSASTTTIGIATGGALIGAGNPVTDRSQCIVDTFSVSSPGNNAPPVICGVNTNMHMYVDAGENGLCNDLSFVLGPGAGITRAWDIKITQYRCDFTNLAPPGCTQWFFGETSGSVNSFNYDGGNGRHLANQRMNICVRREGTNCRICWTASTDADLSISGNNAGDGVAGDTIAASGCCNYGSAGVGLNIDCLNIPNAKKKATVSAATESRYCGDAGGLKVAGAAGGTVCSYDIPFSVLFLSDAYEFLTTTNAEQGDQRGFRLDYGQDAVGC